MKKALVGIVLASLPSFVLAADDASNLKVTVGGDIDVQGGYVNQSKDFRWKTPGDRTSGELNKFAIVNDTNIKIKVEGKSDSLKYGGVVKLQTDTSASKTSSTSPASKTMIFVETPFGRFEGGSVDGVTTDTMHVSAIEIAKGAGGIDGAAPFRVNSLADDTVLVGTTAKNVNTYDVFVTSPYLPVGHDQSPKANCINYFTPSFYGFRFAVGYTPDSEIKGTIFKANNTAKNKSDEYTDIVEAAMLYEGQFNDVSYKTGLMFQSGRAKSIKWRNAGTDETLHRKGLRAWELGLSVGYSGFTVAGSYGDAGRSGTAAQKEANRKYGSSYWNVGTAYEMGPMGMSVTYMESKRAGAPIVFKDGNDVTYAGYSQDRSYNKFKLLSVGAEYKLAPGLLPYAEFSTFEHKRSNRSIPGSADIAAGKTNKGQVYLVGTKLSF
ncbi:porin [Rickettsiales endosymbiont of Peranema trichophorum]|uniref:porin n=1 Tax=Rickettsiales endosymbiont of Peranema trichophorum TaxID=2486577 RepID=UPI0010238912|nr:porin [Rickettsiales endosymbiont of Peranema trichophorum]RZI47400.1 porin [Rickettsiales endosymbiont of Peranema trichophorum]